MVLEASFQAELHVSRRAGAENGIETESNVRGGEERAERSAIDIAGLDGKHSVIQYVEYRPGKSHRETLVNSKILENTHIQL